jgi:hypothetical protein
MADTRGSGFTPSSAQRCNEDVLLDILKHLFRLDLAKAALVCQSWLSAARSQLYHRINFDLQSPYVSRLARTLRTCEHLRQLVRHVKLHREWLGPTYYAELTWIRLLPEHSLLSVEFAFFSELYRLDDVLTYPAIRTASQIIIRSANFTTSARLSAVLNMPGMTSLSVVTGPSHPEIKRTLKLRRLTMLTMGLPDIVCNIVKAIDPCSTLDRFDLVTTDVLDKENISSLLSILEPHLPSLKHLYLASRVQLSDAPFMDDLVASLPSLETVYCGYGSYTSNLLLRLPRSVRSLGFVWGLDGAMLMTGRVGQERILVARPGNVPFPYEEFADAITRYAQGSDTRLQHVALVRPELIHDDHSRLESACRAVGITFEIIEMNYSFVHLLD